MSRSRRQGLAPIEQELEASSSVVHTITLSGSPSWVPTLSGLPTSWVPTLSGFTSNDPLPVRLDHHSTPSPLPPYLQSISSSFQHMELETTVSKFSGDRVLVNDARACINEYIHSVLNNHSSDLKEVSDDEVIESISLGLQQPKEWTMRHLLSNRTTLVKQIVASTAATAIAMGTFSVVTDAIRTGGSIVMPQLDGLLSASQALYILTKTMGLDQMAIRRVNILLEKHPTYLWLRTQKIKIPVPRFLRKYVSEHQSERAYIEIMAEHLMDYMAMEGIRYATIGNIYDYILSAILQGTVSYTWYQGTKLVRALRQMCSTDGFILLANAASSWGKRRDEDEDNPLLLSSFCVYTLDRTIAPLTDLGSGPPFSLADSLTTATTLGTTLAMGLFAAHVAGGPGGVLTHIVQNDAIQQLVLNGMIERSGLWRLITGLATVYTGKTLDKIDATQKEIWQSLVPERGGVWTLNRKELIKQFFSLVLGEQIYSNEMLEVLDVAQLRAVIERQGILIPVASNRWNKAQLRQHIQDAQQQVFHITYRELILNLCKHAMQSIATVALMKGVHAFYASINTATIAKEIGLTPEEIAELNNPDRGVLYDQDVEGVTKVMDYIDNNPDVIEVLLEPIEAMTRDDQKEMIQEKKDLFHAIRQEKIDRAAAYKANQIQAYATKYGITQDQLGNISRLQELQTLIEQQRTSIAETVAGVKTQFGQVDADQLISIEMKNQWETMQFVDLYTQMKNAVTEHLVDSTIIGPLSYANVIINSVNYGKNTYNIGLAFSQLTGVYKEITDMLPYAPVADIPLVASAGQYLENMIIRPQKNVYQVFLEASLDQIKEANFDVRDLAWNIAKRVMGKDSVMTDYHRLRYQNNLIAILLKHPEDART